MTSKSDTQQYVDFLSDAVMLETATHPNRPVRPNFGLAKNLDVLYPFGLPLDG